MSKDDNKQGDPISLDKKTPIKMSLGLGFTLITSAIMITAGGVSSEIRLENKLDEYHKDCAAMYDRSWTISDMSEWTHQANGLSTNHLVPEISEVLRVSRHNEQN